MTDRSQARGVAQQLRRATCLSSTIALALALTASLAQAQSSDGAFIPLPDSAPQSEPSASQALDLSGRFDPARRMAGTDSEPGENLAHRITPLRLLDPGMAMTGAVARISGEREVVTFDLYAGQLSGQQRLQLATVSGINNLPERSQMRVAVNGTEIDRRNLVHIEDFGIDELILPPDLLVPGRNRVQIEFRQHHRIFCGPEASFDLWTDIDLSRSGLVVAHDTMAPGIESFMMALASQAAGGRPVEIRGLDKLGSEAERWQKFLINRLNQVLSGPPVAFDFTNDWTVAGQDHAHARITVLPAAESRLRFVRGGDGAQVMVLEVAQGTRPEDLLTPLPQFAQRFQDRKAPLVEPQQDVSFAELGIPTESFSQHYALRNHAFRLPDDWLVLTASKARIQLDYAYAPNLPEGSMLLLSMNGTSIRLLPLRGEGGVPITAFPIDFEARLMHPGTNILTMQLFVPGNPPDLPCPAIESPVLRIGEGTTLHAPYSPSMAIPDMNLAFSALTPESLRRNDLSRRAYTDLDEMTLAAALAQSQSPHRPSVLHLIAIDDLGSIPTAHHRADRRLLEDTVLIRPDMPDGLSGTGDSTPEDPFAMRRQSARSWSATISAGWDAARARAQWVFDRFFPSSGDQLNTWLAEQSGQAVLFQLDPERPDEIWMLRNPDGEIHDIARAISSVRAAGAGPRGQVSVLTHDGYWMNWLAPDRQPRLLEPWSVQNFRAAMGNFVSARPIFYTILILSISLLSALVALRLVISTREHKT